MPGITARHHRLANTNFHASHQALLSGSWQHVPVSAFRIAVSSMRAQAFVFFSYVFRSNSRLADSNLLAFSQVIA
jgi:hypothetical protein